MFPKACVPSRCDQRLASLDFLTRRQVEAWEHWAWLQLGCLLKTRLPLWHSRIAACTESPCSAVSAASPELWTLSSVGVRSQSSAVSTMDSDPLARLDATAFLRLWQHFDADGKCALFGNSERESGEGTRLGERAMCVSCSYWKRSAAECKFVSALLAGRNVVLRSSLLF